MRCEVRWKGGGGWERRRGGEKNRGRMEREYLGNSIVDAR